MKPIAARAFGSAQPFFMLDVIGQIWIEIGACGGVTAKPSTALTVERRTGLGQK